MLFNSLQYAVFLPATWLVFWLVPVRSRIDVLLLASYGFYASWSPRYAALMFVLAVANYFFGKIISRCVRRRQLILWTCVLADLAVLGFFKYWNFAWTTGTWAVHSITGLTLDPPLTRVALPLGISFFTFEFIHYLVDIYRGSMPVHGFSRFHVFAAFFPTQIAGPIKRFQDFVPALNRLEQFDVDLARDGLRLILRGLVKKVIFADTLAPVANAGFAPAAVQSLGTVEAWVTVLAFSLQIYFDFSGYTDIARGSAQLFGFHIPINFDAPYLAVSPRDFWRRWHISLSTWLRDYVFVPLGGSRVRQSVILRNLLITMIVGGLWHGAAWHFVVWGMFWGFALVAERLCCGDGATVDRFNVGTPRLLAGWAITQCVVLVGWVLFRAASVTEAGHVLRRMVTFVPSTGLLDPRALVGVPVLAVGLLAITVLAPRISWRIPAPVQPVAIGFGTALAIAAFIILAPPDANEFIYFQF